MTLDSMTKITVIDGMEIIVTGCSDDCPFYDRGDDGYGNVCKYPGTKIKLEGFHYKMDDNCPLTDYKPE